MATRDSGGVYGPRSNQFPRDKHEIRSTRTIGRSGGALQNTGRATLALRSRRLTRLRQARGATVHDCTRNDTSIHSAGVNARGGQDSAVLPLLSPPFGWLSLAAACDCRLAALAVCSGRQLIYCIAVETTLLGYARL